MTPETNDVQSRTAADPFLQKLAADEDDGLKYVSLPSSCWISSMNSAKALGLLILFHVLNTVVATVGVVFAVAILTNVALAPAWPVMLAYGTLAVMLFKCVMEHIERGWLQTLVIILLYGLYFLSLFNHYTLIILTIIPLSVYGMVGVQVILCLFSSVISHWLVKKDIQLLKFIESVIPSKASTGEQTLSSQECADRFEVPVPFKHDKIEHKAIPSHVTLNRRVWALIFYYAVLKVVVGGMSALVLVFVLIQPFAAICTLGHDPFLSHWIDSQVRPVVYSIAIVLLWVVGVFGLRVVAKWSVKWTVAVCGPWELDELAHGVESEPEVPSTPEHEPATTSFTQT